MMTLRCKKIQRQIRKIFDDEEFEQDLAAEYSAFSTEEQEKLPKNLRSLQKGFTEFLDAVDAAYSHNETELERLQRSLEVSSREVEERNRDLRLENRKVSNLLNNMRQAIFAVDSHRCIVSPVSLYSHTVFGEEIVGKPVLEVLYPLQQQSAESFTNTRTALSTVFGEDDIQWITMEDFLPKRIEWKEKILKVSCSPLWDDNQRLEKILFIVEDITEVEALERRIQEERAKSSKKFEIIHELLSASKTEVQEFFSGFDMRLTEIQKNGHDQNVLFRLLHTVKGDTRALGFRGLASALHTIEMDVHAQTEAIDLDKLVMEIAKGFKDYQDAYQQIFVQATRTDADIVPVSELALKELRSDLFRLLKDKVPKQQFDQAWNKISYVNLFSIAGAAENAIKEFATRTGKDVGITVQGENVLISKTDYDCVWKLLNQLLSNAVDHGIESPDLRRERNKAAQGHIIVSWDQEPAGLVIRCSDDGGGIDFQHLGEKALAARLVTVDELEAMSEEQRANLIFRQGLSTKDQANELSGLGVGLTVVIEQAKVLSARLHVESRCGSGTTFSIIMNRYARNIAAA
jgi:signal transduction histidine kinase